MKSLIHTLFIDDSNIQSELESVCKEYNDVCKLQEKCDDKYELIKLEKKRLKLNNRIRILNKKSRNL